MARAEPVHPSGHPDYECLVEPEGHRWRWTAYHEPGEGPRVRIRSGASRWKWRASQLAEDACRAHLLDGQWRRAQEASRLPRRWQPAL